MWFLITEEIGPARGTEKQIVNSWRVVKIP